MQDTQTIINLLKQAEHFKKEVLKCKETIKTEKRNYLKPEEDDKINHLKLSYIKTRAALLESALEAEKQIIKNNWDIQQYVEFMIGYSSALALVSTARFLSKHFSNDPVIKNKLNEPDPALGIEKGLYENIQKSLNDSKKIMHLHNANTLYRAWTEKFEKSPDKHLQKINTIVKKMIKEVNLESADFFQERLNEWRGYLWEMIYAPLLEKAYDIQKSISKSISEISLNPQHKPEIPEKIQSKICELIEPGDVFITRKEHALTNYFLPGYWPHAALYIGKKSNENAVLESLKDGVKIRNIESSFSNDCLAVIRPILNNKEIRKAIKRGLKHEGKPYDFDFDFKRSDRLVCTEVIYRTYENSGGIQFKLTNRAGRLNLSAEDLLQMALDQNGFKLITVYCGDESKELLFEKKSIQILKKTMGKKKPLDIKNFF